MQTVDKEANKAQLLFFKAVKALRKTQIRDEQLQTG